MYIGDICVRTYVCVLVHRLYCVSGTLLQASVTGTLGESHTVVVVKFSRHFSCVPVCVRYACVCCFSRVKIVKKKTISSRHNNCHHVIVTHRALVLIGYGVRPSVHIVGGKESRQQGIVLCYIAIGRVVLFSLIASSPSWGVREKYRLLLLLLLLVLLLHVRIIPASSATRMKTCSRYRARGGGVGDSFFFEPPAEGEAIRLNKNNRLNENNLMAIIEDDADSLPPRWMDERTLYYPINTKALYVTITQLLLCLLNILHSVI